jgi:hypothetical protein
MKIQDHEETITFAVTNTGRNHVILGHAWLACHNPLVNWKTNAILFTRCPRECTLPQIWNNGPEILRCVDNDGVEVEDDKVESECQEAEEGDTISVMYGSEAKWKNLEDGERLFVMPEDVEMIRAYSTLSQRLAKEAK